MEIVANSENKDGATEDVFIADLVWRKYGLVLHEDKRYMYYPGCRIGTDTISFHISSCNGWPGDVPSYGPEQMYTRYQEMKGSECLQENCQVDC